jgi:hypothetical protein
MLTLPTLIASTARETRKDLLFTHFRCLCARSRTYMGRKEMKKKRYAMKAKRGGTYIACVHICKEKKYSICTNTHTLVHGK